MQLKPNEFDRMINKYRENGIFEVDERDSSDKFFTIFYILEENGKKKRVYVTRTKRSHGSKPMEGHIRSIQKQLFLSEKELQDLRDCPLRSNRIAELYKERNRI